MLPLSRRMGLALLLWPSCVFAQNPAPTLNAAAVDAFQAACLHSAPLHDRASLERWLAAEGTFPDAPLARLSAGGRRRFLAALHFESGMTVGLDTADLEAELTLSQAWRVLTMFGWQWAVTRMPDAHIETEADRTIDTWRAALAHPEGP